MQEFPRHSADSQLIAQNCHRIGEVTVVAVVDDFIVVPSVSSLNLRSFSELVRSRRDFLGLFWIEHKSQSEF